VAEVTTTSGPVRGRRTPTGTVFLGVPYAAGPTGAGRFAAPRPHPGWAGVRDATRPGPTAPQPARDMFGALDMSPFFGAGWRRGDDYLTVNIWAPQPAGPPAPILVFVPGGGFVAGSADAPLYDGSAFTRDGVVLVTVNYRLGIPGFLHLGDAPDNRAQLDVLAALRWIRDNASGFGGDAGNVTLAGQSAGATIVGAVLADPAARGLVHRAIMQSGNGRGAFTPAQARLVTEAVGRVLGVDPAVPTLAGLSDERLVGVVPQLSGIDLDTAGARDPLGGISPFSLVRNEQPAAAVARGAGHDIALLAGNTSEEGRLYLAPHGLLDDTKEADVTATAAAFHDDPGALLAAYRRSRPDATDPDLRAAILGDGLFGAGTRAMTAAHAPAPAGTYEYEFTWRSDSLDGQLGASHVLDLPFVFDVLHQPGLYGRRALLGATAPPADLARRVHRGWVRFAATGDPGWAASVPGVRRVQRLGPDWRLVENPRPEEYAAWTYQP
jgi:para-nitrobenzyl esterase